MLLRLWNFLRWYPWKSQADLIRWRDRNWWPWKESDWSQDRLGRYALKTEDGT